MRLARQAFADRLPLMLVGAVLEVWAQHWEGRIADIRPRLSLARMGSGGGADWPG